MNDDFDYDDELESSNNQEIEQQIKQEKDAEHKKQQALKQQMQQAQKVAKEKKEKAKDKKEEKKEKAKKAAGETAKAAVTGGVSLVGTAAGAVKDKAVKGIGKMFGINTTRWQRKFKKFMWLAFGLCIFALVALIWDMGFKEESIMKTSSTLSQTQAEIGKDLIKFTDDDFKKLREAYEEENKKNTEDSAVTQIKGTEISNITTDEALDTLIKYMRSLQSNFNKIDWLMVDGSTGESVKPQVYKTDYNLLIPITEKNSDKKVEDTYVPGTNINAMPSEIIKAPKAQKFEPGNEAVNTIINETLPYAIRNYREARIMPSITIAHALAGSNNGKSDIFKKGFNYYALKVDKSWRGQGIRKSGEQWRVYLSKADSHNDYYTYINNNDKLSKEKFHTSTTFDGQVNIMKRAEVIDDKFEGKMKDAYGENNLAQIDEYVKSNPTLKIEKKLEIPEEMPVIEDKYEKQKETPWLEEGFEQIPEDTVIEAVQDFLQPWIIPYTLNSYTGSMEFGLSVLEKMYHIISADVYQLFQYEETEYHNMVLATESYQETVYYLDENGEERHKVVSSWRVKTPHQVISDNVTTGETKKWPKENKIAISRAETYKGIMEQGATLTSKKQQSTTEGTVSLGTAGPDGCPATRTDIVKYADEVSASKKEIKSYTVNGETPEGLKYNRIQFFLQYEDTFRKLGLSKDDLNRAYESIGKNYKDPIESYGEAPKTNLGTKVVLEWPVKDANLVGYYFNDVNYYDYSEGQGLKGVLIDPGEKKDLDVTVAKDGKVVTVVRMSDKSGGVTKDYGNLVKILHSSGVMTVYGYLDNINDDIKVGAEVKTGQVIGKLGKTGKAKFPCLYFQVLESSVAVDPMEYFSYEEKTMTYDKRWKKVKIYLGPKRAAGGGRMVMTAQWQKKIDDMLTEALAMKDAVCMEYSQTNGRPIKTDERPTTGDCSSFVANLYYRYFNHGYIGNSTHDQYPHTTLQGIECMEIKNWANPDGTVNDSVLKPGDLIFNGRHVMMYVGTFGGHDSGTFVHHGGGSTGKVRGPTLAQFNNYSANDKAEYTVNYATRYYQEGDVQYVGGGPGLGGIELGGSVPSEAYNAAMRYFSIIEKWSREFGLDPYVVVAMIAQESGGNPNSDNGAAVGLMQIEYIAGSQNQTCYYLDGRTEKVSYSRAELLDPEKNIKTGCAQFRNRINEYKNNLLVAIQGYNYGPGGIARCIGYSLSGGSNTGSAYCGYSMDEIKEYAGTFDTKWLEAREWYTSTGWRHFGGGGGTKDHLERCLRYYDTRGGTEYPYVVDYATGEYIYFGMPGGVGTPGEFPPYRQIEEPWASISYTKSNIKGSSYTMRACGCGPTSTAIILSGIGVVVPGYDGVYYNGYQSEADGKMDPAETAKFFIDNNCKDRGVDSSSGSSSAKFGDALKKACSNLDVQFVEGNINKCYDMIANQGYVAVANSNTEGGGRVHFTSGGHYIAVVGVEDGKFIVIDPASTKRDGSSCPGCGYGCGNVAYTPQMMGGSGSVSKGGIRRMLLLKAK